MIGGIDVRLPSRAGVATLQIAARSIRSISAAHAVFENGQSGERYASFEDVPFDGLGELFIYRTAAEADAWETHGAIPELSNSMAHLIADRDSIHVVFDTHDPMVDSILETIRAGVNENFSPADLRVRS